MWKATVVCFMETRHVTQVIWFSSLKQISFLRTNQVKSPIPSPRSAEPAVSWQGISICYSTHIDLTCSKRRTVKWICTMKNKCVPVTDPSGGVVRRVTSTVPDIMQMLIFEHAFPNIAQFALQSIVVIDRSFHHNLFNFSVPHCERAFKWNRTTAKKMRCGCSHTRYC